LRWGQVREGRKGMSLGGKGREGKQEERERTTTFVIKS